MANFAYVKFVDDDVRTIVPIENIKKKQDMINGAWDKRRLYSVKYHDGGYYKANVLCLAETHSDLLNMVATKRISCPPSKLSLNKEETTDTESAAEGGIYCDPKNARRKKKTLDEDICQKANSQNFNEILKEMNNNENSVIIPRTKPSPEKIKSPTSCNQKSTAGIDNTCINDVENGASFKYLPDVSEQNTVDKKYAKLKEKNKRLKEQIKMVQEREKTLQQKYDVLQNEFEELKMRDQKKNHKKLEKLEKINLELQEKILSKWDEVIKNNTNVEGRSANVDDVPAVEFRSNAQVHLGRGVWLPVHQYDSIDLKGKNPSKFVREMAVNLFGTHVLAASSVTGIRSNRTKGEAKPALDPQKLMAIKDILRHRLENRGEPPNVVQEACDSVPAIIAQKILDICRPSRSKKNVNPEIVENFFVEADQVGENMENNNGDDDEDSDAVRNLINEVDAASIALWN